MPWNGPVAAIVSAPETWVVDNEHSPLLGSANPSDMPQFTMYPLGHTRESALQREAFVYGKIILKSPDAPTLEAIATLNERAVLEQCPTAVFERLAPLEREPSPGREAEKTLFRVGHIHSGYGGPEYSLYIDHPKGVLLLVMFCPENRDDIYVPVLKWIGQKAIMMDYDEPTTTG